MSPYLVAEFRRQNAGKKQSKAKETSTNAKRKEPPPAEPSEGRNKRQAVENGDEDNSDWGRIFAHLYHKQD